MITKQYLGQVLSELDFEKRSGSLFVKQYAVDCLVTVDFDKPTDNITYPDGLKVNDRTTCNFSHNENFVVLECVVRLLDKGYAAEDIELEPKWALGHGAKGGKADIWVRHYRGQKLEDSAVLIECKTPGREFDGAWADTLEDGAQLFSYFSQEVKTRFLCLYTSDFADGKIATDYRLINVTDNDEYLKTLVGKKKVLTFTREDHHFEKAGNDKERFRAWAKTYQKEFQTRGLFESDIDTWDIGKKRYTTDDLDHVSAAVIRKKYNEFATILRKYNVSGHENAFDKLVNLFLAKIVDEKENPSELQFYWKGLVWDNDFALQDRLQRLYKVGMERFLGEEVTYIDDKKIDCAFRLFKNDKDATRDTVQKYVRMLKFFTNNDFAFIDVHNEHLFYQNAVILKAVVNMLKDIRLRDDDLHGEHQLLGDLFEGFLDQGVKQSEGQFFTPMPYVKFMISSLPLWDLVAGRPEPPRVIDYACGAGHFLNEYAGQIRNGVVALKKRPEDYFAAITGVEKEYRLSKVTKVAAFMYGQDQINVVYGDALSDLSSRGVGKDGSYDLLVANPPYSVKGFLETLDANDRAKYRLADAVSDAAKCDDIETFFVERAAQLLGDGGLAAIILPSTILSNDGIFATCRDILLESFEFVAIAEMGSGTFGKTGTNTVTLFLRRREGDPDLATHARNRAEAWFAGDFTKDGVFDDAKVVVRYAAVVGVSPDDYRTLLVGAPNAALLEAEPFANYRAAFAAETKAKKIAAKPLRGDYDAAARRKELEDYVLGRIVETEREKLRVFMLADANPQPVVVVRSPTDTKAVKTFLGYEWSSRKGDEGIKYVGVTTDEDDGISRNRGIDQIQTPLFNPQSLDDASKINTLIRRNFQGKPVAVPEHLAEFVSKVNLVDMIDFSRTDFDKAIQTSRQNKAVIDSQYPLVPLSSFAQIERGVVYNKDDQVPGETSTVVLTADNITLSGELEITKKVFLRAGLTLDDDKLLKKGDCFVCFSSGSKKHIGKVAYISHDTQYYAGGFMGILRSDNKIANSRFVHLLLNMPQVRELMRNTSNGANIQNLSNAIGDIKLPLPPLAVQKKIAAECEKVDAECAAQRKAIADCNAEIDEMLSGIRNHAASADWIGGLLETYLLEVNDGNSKVPANRIQPMGRTPVVTQEVGPVVSGYADGCEPIKDLPLIVFGDHSCTFKYVDFPFVRGADGTQLLKFDSGMFDARFMCSYLKRMPLPKADKYERHMKYLKAIRILVPPLSEQKKVAAKIEKIEAKIAAANAIVANAADKKSAILDKYLK